MFKKSLLFFVLCVLIISSSNAGVLNLQPGFSLAENSFTGGDLIEQLSTAKHSGDAASVISIQQRIDEMAGISAGVSVDCESHIYPLRALPERASEKSFGSDIYVASSGNFEGKPAIATSSDGAIFVAFKMSDSEHSHKYIAVVKSTDGGETWTPLIQITNDSYDLNYPQIAIGEGEQNWVFLSCHTSSNDVQVARFSFTGAGGEIHSIDGSSFTGKSNARIITDTDSYYYVYVAYIRSNIWGTDVHLARSTDFGLTWSLIDFTSEGAGYCDIAYTQLGGLVITTQTGDGEESSIWASRSSDYGVTWSDGSTVASSGAYPRIAADGENAAIVYTYKYSDSDHDIYSAISTDGGINWGSEFVALTFRNEKYADIVSSDNAFLVSYWEQGKVVMVSRPFDGYWGTSSDVSDEATAQETFPAIAVSNEAPGGCPAIVWENRFTESDHDVLFDKNCCEDLTANLSAVPTSGTAPLEVIFRNNSTGLIESAFMNFGDGDTSSTDSIAHTYSEPGTYYATLTVSNFCTSQTDTAVITVSCPELSARISASEMYGTAPMTVTFVDSSQGYVSSRMWYFGDGDSSSNVSVEHIFTEVGNYTVSLIVDDPCGDVDTATTTIWVNEPAGPEFRASTGALEFGEVSVGGCGPQYLGIGNTGAAELTIDSVNFDNANFSISSSLPMTIEVGEWDSITVQYCPTAAEADSGIMTLFTNDTHNPTVPVWLYGSGVITPASALSLTPHSLVFDSVAMDDCNTKRITVRNNGDVPIAITSMTLVGSGAFSITGHDTFTVDPDEWKYITIQFCPYSSSSAYAGTLIVQTEVGEYTIPLAGYTWTAMTCIDYGSFQICSDNVTEDRVYGNIRLVNASGDTIAYISSIGDVGAYIDLDLEAGTGLARFAHEDGSKPYVYGGAFDLTYDGIRFRFDPSTSMLPDSILDKITPDSLMGAPFSYTASLDPAEINVDEGWWQISGDISINNGANFIGSIGIYRRSYYDGTVEYYVDEFEIGLWDNAFRFKFQDVYVSGDTIYAGRIYMKVNSSLIPSTSFIDGGYFQIDAHSLAIYDGKLIDLDLAITFPDFVFPAGGRTVGIRRAKLRLVWEDGVITRFSGGGRFEISGLMSGLGSDTYIGAYVTIIRDVGLDDVRLEFMGWSPGVPLGATGFFLTGVNGEVRHITDPSNIYIQFGCQLTGGPSVPYFGSVVRMEPSVWIDFEHDEFGLEGAVRFLEHLARGEAGLRYQWNYGGGGWALTGYANLRTTFSSHIWAQGGTELSMWREPVGDFHFTGDAGVEVHIDHHAIAWLFPTHDIEVDGDLYFGEFKHGGDSGGHWGVKGEAYLNFFGLRPSIAYIDGSLSLMSEARAYTPLDMLRTFYCKSSLVSEDLSYDMNDDDMKMFILRTNEDVHPSFSVETPEGHTITLDSCSYSEDAELVRFDGYYDGDYYQGMMIKRSDAGIWTAHINDLPAGDSDHLVQVKSFRNALGLGLSTTSTGSGFDISGDISGAQAGDTVVVTLMLKPMDITAGAMPIDKITLTDDFSIDRTYNFDELGFQEGNYYLVAYAEDQNNRFASLVDSVDVISFPEDDVAPSAPTGALASWVNDETVRITWQYNPERDVVGYKVHKGWQQSDHIDWWETIDVADVNYYAFDNAKVMVPDTLDFVFGVSAYDNAGNESEITVVTPFGSDPAERDTIPPFVEITSVIPNLADKMLLVSWNGDADVYSYVLTVGTAPGEITYSTQLPADSTEYTFENLIVGGDYYVSIIAVDSALNYSSPDSESVAFYDIADSDGDGIPDWWEEYFFGSIDSCAPDGDDDGDLITNRNEYLAGTNPRSSDTDGDGVPDLAEIASPELDPNSDADADGDRLPDDWENYFFGSDTIRGLANMDNDDDGLSNLEEYQHNTDPHNYDTDGGGLSDGEEVMLESDPNDPADDDDISFTIHLENGWNMISLPVQPYITDWRQLFPTAIEAFGYDPATSSYFAADELDMGRGYWILSIGEMDVTITGTPMLSYTISCSAGWNIIAAPASSEEVSTTLITTSPDGLFIPPVYSFDGDSYSSTAELESGMGYWAFLSGDCSLIVDESYAGFGRGYSSNGYATGNPPPPPSAEMASIPDKLALKTSPTPFNSSTEITVQMPQNGNASLKIYDYSGKLVRNLFSGELSVGTHSLEWNAETDDGEPAATGLYIIRIDTPNGAAVTKALLVR